MWHSSSEDKEHGLSKKNNIELSIVTNMEFGTSSRLSKVKSKNPCFGGMQWLPRPVAIALVALKS